MILCDIWPAANKKQAAIHASMQTLAGRKRPKARVFWMLDAP